MNDTRCFFVWGLPCQGGRYAVGSGVVFFCEILGGPQLCGHTFLTCILLPVYSTTPVLPALIIQLREEKLLLRNPPPTHQYESNKKDKEVDGFGSRGVGGFKKKRWSRNKPPRHQWILQERSEFVEKMEAKRRRKIEWGWASAEPADAALQGCKKLLTWYKGSAEANPSNDALTSVRGGMYVPDEIGRAS